MSIATRWAISVSLVAVLATLAACASLGRPVQTHVIDPIGYFEYRPPDLRVPGVIIAAPHGDMVPGAAAVARWISDRSGAGFIVAYGFKSNRVSVEEPVVRSSPHEPVRGDPGIKRRSVFAEFKQLLQRMTNMEVDLYVGLRARDPDATPNGIEVVASGFTFEELQWIDRAYGEIRDRLIGAASVEKLPLFFAPVDRVSLDGAAIKHHGALLIAAKGLGLHVPEKFLYGANLRVYRRVFLEWIKRLEYLVHGGFPRALQIQVKLMDFGRFDLIPSRTGHAGVVIGAPHGTYDEYTAEIAKRLALRTGLAAVVARGFTPAETGGWRINVNRPTEKTFLAPEFESRTSRSRAVYEVFRNLVLDAAGGDLRMYVDVHQYGRDATIQVATVGIKLAQARKIKENYRNIRDRLLKENPGVGPVEFVIEPLDALEVGAWPAKHDGLLSVARKSLHIELPLHTALRSEKSRGVYATIIAELVKAAVSDLSE